MKDGLPALRKEENLKVIYLIFHSEKFSALAASKKCGGETSCFLMRHSKKTKEKGMEDKVSELMSVISLIGVEHQRS